MSEVILIYIHHKDGICIVPMGTFYIGSYLKENSFSVRIFNFIIGEDKKISENELTELKKELKDCLCIGMSVMTLQVPKSLELTNLIKNINPSVKMVWGGAHPTLFPKQCIENKNIDFIIIKEGEEPFLELAKQLKNKEQNFEKINGLVFKKNGKTIQNPPQPLFEGFEKMMPDWDLIEDFARNNMEMFTAGDNYKVIEIHTGRGCPYECTFCINETFFGKTRRWRPIDNIIEEIKLVRKKFNPSLISLRDENFFINRKKVEEFCDKLKKENLKIKWITNCRVNYFDNFDDQFLQKVKESGCIGLSFGAESGSQKSLNYIKKGITPAQTYNATKKCVQYGILPTLSFMIGLPNETKKDRLDTLRLIKKLKKLSNRVGFTGLHILRPYPGGKLYDQCISYGVKEPKKLEDWDKKNKEYFTQYLNAQNLLWIKDPETIEVITKYAPKGFNNFILTLNINPLWKPFLKIRTALFDYLTYNFAKTDNKSFKKLLKKGLEMTDNLSNNGKIIFKKIEKNFKKM